RPGSNDYRRRPQLAAGIAGYRTMVRRHGPGLRAGGGGWSGLEHVSGAEPRPPDRLGPGHAGSRVLRRQRADHARQRPPAGVRHGAGSLRARGWMELVLRVGLTGGIGSGKSTVAERLASLGAVLVDADKIAREVVEPGTPGHAAVVREFGRGVLAPDGSLDRAALGKVIFE